jgi:FAD/FMN-containing dehydrogenase
MPLDLAAPLSGEFVQRLTDILGPSGVRWGEALSAIDPGIEKRNLDSGLAVLPTTTNEVAAVLALCHQERVPIVPLGGRTGLAQAGVSKPGDLVLLTTRLNHILEIDADASTATVETGVPLGTLAKAAAEYGLIPAIDLGARDSCTIGGLMSTNAGGMEAFRFGPMRRRVLGLEVVLADGSVLTDMKKVIKNNEGYDLKQLFIGAEGTLGVITKAVLKLEPDPGERALAYCHLVDAASAIALLAKLRRLPRAELTRAEIIWREHANLTATANGLGHLCAPDEASVVVLFEAASNEPGSAREALESELSAALEGPGLVDVILPKNERETREIWKIREDWAVDRAFPRGLWYDISVPLGQLDAYMQRLRARIKALDASLRVFTLAHLADGNLHVTVNSDIPITDRASEVTPLVFDGLREMGGSISAEHGIGLGRREALASFADPVKLALMRTVKTALDPRGIMNPGKILA